MAAEIKTGWDKVSLWGVIAGVIVWILSVLWVGINWRGLPPELPLFYSLPVGESQLILKQYVFLVVGGFGAMMGVNLVAMKFFVKEEELLRQFLAWGGVVVQIMLLLTLINVIRIVR